MEPEAGSFTQLQLSRRSRSKSSIWRASDVEAASISPSSRRSTVRESVVSVADMWAQGRSRDSLDSTVSIGRSGSQASFSSNRGGHNELRRWDGSKRSTTPWDEIRRDPELWFPDGDCFIHFYGRGSSRRGPSLRLHRDDLETAGCMRMLSKFADNALLEEDEDEEFSHTEEENGPDGGFRSNPNTRGKDELFIPAPPLLNRDEALKFHVTTRNFFACIYSKPMIGHHLGEALVLVHERFNMYRPDKEKNRDDMLDYCDDQEYTDFRDCPDHAMAMMYYAEKLRETDLWTEAFVHSVGMYDILNTAIEFPTVSRTIGALITRAHLEMTLRLEHAYADLGGFMEDSIASAFPKLPEPALKHLERFRGFLQSFYVQQHGYWPPPTLTPGADFSVVTKSLLRSIYNDLRNLYLFLRDPKSDPKPTQAQLETYKAIYGGIVTPQLIQAFDKRFKHTSLPNPLPLLPSGVSGQRSPVNGSTRNLAGLDVAGAPKPPSGGAFARFLRPSKRKSQKALNTLNMLSAATNTNDPNVMDSLLVQEYSRFERDYTVRGEEKYDPVEGRKVRWLLVYALLQTVIGVIATPREVSSTEKVEYPLCVQTGGTPPWRKRMKVKAVMDGAATPILDALSAASSPSASPYMTPRSSSAMSGTMSPISAADYIPPVPQLVLSELNKLNGGSRGSFDSGHTGSRSPAPPGSSADSIRSVSTARPGKSNLKSSSASIRSTGSTRSSFSAMMNRSLGMGGLSNPDMHVPREPERRPIKPKEPKQPKESKRSKERPQIQQQKSAPAAAHAAPDGATGKKLRKEKPTSMFGWSRSTSRQASPNRQSTVTPGRETPVASFRDTASPAPTSPAQSTFSNMMSDSRFESMRADDDTPATSEFPQSARLGQQQQHQHQPSMQEQPAQRQPPVRGPPRLAPLHTIGAEPERGRAAHAPYSPSIGNASTPTKKVRNFSRGRSMDRSSPLVSPVNGEAPPPIPSGTKPPSRGTSPAPDTQDLYRAYTDAGLPPRLPEVNLSSKPPSRAATPVRSPVMNREQFSDARSAQAPPTPVHSKPRSRAQSMSRSPERELGDELPPPLPMYSKPSSRAQSPAPAVASTNGNVAPPISHHSKPNSRANSVSRLAKTTSNTSTHQQQTQAQVPPMPIHSKPNSRANSVSRPARAEPQQASETMPPPIPTRSKPTTRNASPVRAPQVRSPTERYYESALQSPATETEPISPSNPVLMSDRMRPSSRSTALRPAAVAEQAYQQVQAPARHPADQNISMRPSTGASEATTTTASDVSSSSRQDEEDELEGLQRITTNSKYSSALATGRSNGVPSARQTTQRQAPVQTQESRAADRPDRQYQRAPAAAEHSRFESTGRAVIDMNEQPEEYEENETEEDTDSSFVGHAVTAPGNVAQRSWQQSQAQNRSQAPVPAPAQPKVQSSAYPTLQPAPQSQSQSQPRTQAQTPSSRTPQPSYQQQLQEHEQRTARITAPGTSAARHGSSRESKYRRAAWAELSMDEATGMPVPRQIRQYGGAAPVARDARAPIHPPGGSEEELTNSEDEGPNGGLGSYGVRKGIVG